MRYVALLRGINVGGKNMIKMDKLRGTFAQLDFENVATYINSGNIAFDSRTRNEANLVSTIHDAIESDFGFNISTMVRSMDEIAEIIANSPYIGQFENDKDLHVFFLPAEMTTEQQSQLLDLANDNEFITVSGRTIYYMLRISILDSALGKGFLDKKLKITNSARNWRTVNKLVEL
ncbi:MAG: DUF1697 domain-containing protein [Pyrinomonadaceae bacterium]